MGEAAILAENLSKHFGEIEAVQNLNLEVKKGEAIAFLGPNGAGKTTTVRMLTGMIAPTHGNAEVAKLPVSRAEKLHERIGLLTEIPGFYDKLSAERNLEYFSRFYPLTNVPNRVAKYLQMMGLWERRNHRVGTLSRGMKQRLALCRAMIHDPEILFLDEPTSALDPAAAREVRRLILEMKGAGRTVFLCTHNLEEAELICDRIAVFRNHLIALDTSTNLRERIFRRQVVVELEHPVKGLRERMRKRAFVLDANWEGSQLIVELKDFDRYRPALVEEVVAAGGKVREVFERKHSLEDVYLALLEEEKKNG